MRYSARDIHDRVTVPPGGQHATRAKTVISTLLGSCVAACLYDEEAGVAGMNHFLLANRRYSKSLPLTATEAGRYGIHAMELLINGMMKLGASRARIKAKVFGAGQIFAACESDNFLCVGEVNERFIREYLTAERMRLVSDDLGGELGRVIHFHTDTFQVFRRYIPKNRSAEIVKVEHGFWATTIQNHERSDEGDVTLFR